MPGPATWIRTKSHSATLESELGRIDGADTDKVQLY